MPPDETECDNCGAFVIDEAVVRLCRAFGIPREKALALFEKGFRHPKQLKDRNVDDVLQRGENGLLFLCMNCGGFVATGDTKCPRCGAEFEIESAEPASEKDILDTTLCPVCGADNDATWKECEICGETLGGTEEPPGADETAAHAAATTPPPRSTPPAPIPQPKPAEAVRSPTLDRIDDILKELDLTAPPKSSPPPPGGGTSTAGPETSNPAAVSPAVSPSPAREPVRRRLKRTKKISRKPAVIPAEPTLRPRPRPRPVARATRLPKARAERIPKPAPRKVTWQPRVAPLPSEFTGGLTVAAAASLILSLLLGEAYIAWGVVFVITAVAAYVVATVAVRRGPSLRRADGLLLITGATVSAVAPAGPADLALILSGAGAVILALATRRLLGSRVRDLIVAASDVPLVALAVVAALGFTFAGSPAWTFGLAALVPWPAAVAIEGGRQRRSGFLLHRELAKAQGHLEREQWAASVRNFDRAITLGRKGTPGEEMPWYGKGASLILLGQYEEALRAIDKALDLNPRNEVAWLNKGNALTKLGRLVDALRCFNAAIKVNPKYEIAWNNKGNTLVRLGHPEEALACYDRAIELDPGYRGAWVNKGFALTRLGRYAEATACADRAMRLDDRGGPRAARTAETSTGVPSS